MEKSEILEQRSIQEWLVTNGLGGYASGTVSGILTRRYHGYLVAAMPNPLGRVMMLNYIAESLIFPDGAEVRLTGEERLSCDLQMHGTCFISDFFLDMGLPVWRYKINEVEIEKRVLFRYRQNTVQISYRLLSGNAPILLTLVPAMHFRLHNHPLSPLSPNYSLNISDNQYEIKLDEALPVLRLTMDCDNPVFKIEKKVIEEFIYSIEKERGYKYTDSLWTPGVIEVKLMPAQEVFIIASTETWDTIKSLTPTEAMEAEVERRRLLCERAPSPLRTGLGADLLLSADQFIVRPASRWKDIVRTHASGDSARSVIAGYHWFTDWGRDTMISLEGLTLLTGRYHEAGWILRTFSRYIKDGLIPNLFPEQQEQGSYSTADATLWFFHALERYTLITKDWATIRLLLPRLREIIRCHITGTQFGIGVDPSDRLLKQGKDGYALTWMDAKVGDLVVTPRRGKAVEINALWYNALKLMEKWITEEGKDNPKIFAQESEQVRQSFNKRFWHDKGGYLFDVVDGEIGNDASLRPNQIFAISLDYPVLDNKFWRPVLDSVKTSLLTPFGLRTLAPNHPDYQRQYAGDILARDKSYHQGTIWPWLIGHYIDAWLKVYPEERNIDQMLAPLLKHFQEQACLGSVSEVFDAEEIFLPRGCGAQAWSVAELLRAWIKTKGNDIQSEL